MADTGTAVLSYPTYSRTEGESVESHEVLVLSLSVCVCVLVEDIAAEKLCG